MPSLRAILVAVAIPFAANTQPLVYEYRVKAAVPRTGSHFTDTIVWQSPYPFDKALVELPEQAAALSRRALGITDTSIYPPLPTRPLTEIFSSVATLPLDLGVTGLVELFVEVDEEGSVTRIMMTTASKFRLTDQYVTAFRRAKFAPGKCGGKACKGEFVYVAWFKRE
jgi:hypothetical protein